MLSDEILNSLAAYIASEFLNQPDRKINSADALLTSGLIDSFHLVDLALFVEDKFGVHIDDSELNASSFDTLEELAMLIKSRQ